MNIPQLDNTYIANTYARFPVTIARGKGSLVWDENGKVYITWRRASPSTASASPTRVDPRRDRAAVHRAARLQPLLHRARRAAGAAAVREDRHEEGLLLQLRRRGQRVRHQAARKYAADHKGPEYSTIITLKNSFHGRTITTLAATGQDVFHHDFCR